MSLSGYSTEELAEVKLSLETLQTSNQSTIDALTAELSLLTSQMETFQTRIDEINATIANTSRNNYLIGVILPTFSSD